MLPTCLAQQYSTCCCEGLVLNVIPVYITRLSIWWEPHPITWNLEEEVRNSASRMQQRNSAWVSSLQSSACNVNSSTQPFSKAESSSLLCIFHTCPTPKLRHNHFLKTSVSKQQKQKQNLSVSLSLSLSHIGLISLVNSNTTLNVTTDLKQNVSQYIYMSLCFTLENCSVTSFLFEFLWALSSVLFICLFLTRFSPGEWRPYYNPVHTLATYRKTSMKLTDNTTGWYKMKTKRHGPQNQTWFVYRRRLRSPRLTVPFCQTEGTNTSWDGCNKETLLHAWEK